MAVAVKQRASEPATYTAEASLGLPKEMVDEYLEMVSYMRPAGSAHERKFINRYIRPLKPEVDEMGNLYVTVGSNPTVLWSCHTDTVHRRSGRHDPLVDDEGFVFVNPDGRGQPNCLGADCTTGVWLMVNMIRQGKPGLYVFHRAEEIGCVGSMHIANNEVHRLAGIKYAIAFDRYGYNSVITHQANGRGCSDTFAKALAEQFIDMGGQHRRDDGGVYTDTNEYFHLIPECTNISVGYFSQHTTAEVQSLEFLGWLFPALMALDVDALPAERDPADVDVYDYYSDGPYSGRRYYDYTDDDRYLDPADRGDDLAGMVSIIKAEPELVAQVLREYGMSELELAEEVYNKGGLLPL